MPGASGGRRGEADLEEFVRAAHLALLETEPGPAAYAEHLASLRNGGSMEQVLRQLLESPRPADVFEAIEKNWVLLEALDADVTIPLEGCRALAGPLKMRGPVRDRSVFKWIVKSRGIWEPHVTKLLGSMLRPGQVFMDAGANLGYFSILGGSLVGPSGRLISFEPSTSNFTYCRDNVIGNGLTNSTLLRLGLWNEPTDQKEILREHDFLGGAFVADADRFEGSPEFSSEPLECVRFDDLVSTGRIALSQLDLVKMDIEGSESFALEGMTRTLERTRPFLVLELNAYCLALVGSSERALWDRLQDLNYRVMALPKSPAEEAMLESLWLPLRWPEMGLREFENFNQVQEVVRQVNMDVPDAFDIIALPNESRREPFWR